jgi:hypothetical protein
MRYWAYRRAVILLYAEKAIGREKFIRCWRAAYGR